ncbi:MAG: hypothetical protein EA376_12765 [Phycisphaeraceae bacterium]|nr:MAG: hypothetical protein EA376_12765 [Phycisphaeraceae bacterium]
MKAFASLNLLTFFTRALVGAAIIALAGMATLVSYRMARTHVASEIYRDRLQTLAGDYERLRELHNEAVRRTAVTELVVKDRELSVQVRTAEGVDRVVKTPYDPMREIYVDYVVVQGRLWIRRIFDARTAPGDGVVIEPLLGEIDWDDERYAVGKAVYRRLGEGRWIVTVTGDGSLGLARIEHGQPIELQPIPEIREYAEIEREVKRAVDEITLGEALRRMTRAGDGR